MKAQAENVRNYVRLKRNVIPDQQHAAEKRATREPHDGKAPQKILEIMDSGWATRRDDVDENKKTKKT